MARPIELFSLYLVCISLAMASKWEEAFFWPKALAFCVGIWVLIHKEVISDMKRENKFFAIDIWAFIWLMIKREICKPVLKLDFTAQGIMESFLEFGISVLDP
jgi:hypothetical protein